MATPQVKTSGHAQQCSALQHAMSGSYACQLDFHVVGPCVHRFRILHVENTCRGSALSFLFDKLGHVDAHNAQIDLHILFELMQEVSAVSHLVATMVTTAMVVLEVMEELRLVDRMPTAAMLMVFQTAIQILMAQTALEGVGSRLAAKVISKAACFRGVLDRQHGCYSVAQMSMQLVRSSQ